MASFSSGTWARLRYSRGYGHVRMPGVLVQNSRYTDDTQSVGSFVFPIAIYRALRCDRCLVIPTCSSVSAPFHGGNTGSNPVGDAKPFQELTGNGHFWRRHRNGRQRNKSRKVIAFLRRSPEAACKAPPRRRSLLAWPEVPARSRSLSSPLPCAASPELGPVPTTPNLQRGRRVGWR
jgi:hypothetical protein